MKVALTKLYHGSTVAVRKPSLRPGRANADFGKGFYTTTNDKVFTTVNLFESGVLSAEAAILQLKAYKTYDQLSFHTERAISTLRFLESFQV